MFPFLSVFSEPSRQLKGSPLHPLALVKIQSTVLALPQCSEMLGHLALFYDPVGEKGCTWVILAFPIPGTAPS